MVYGNMVMICFTVMVKNSHGYDMLSWLAEMMYPSESHAQAARNEKSLVSVKSKVDFLDTEGNKSSSAISCATEIGVFFQNLVAQKFT